MRDHVTALELYSEKLNFVKWIINLIVHCRTESKTEAVCSMRDPFHVVPFTELATLMVFNLRIAADRVLWKRPLSKGDTCDFKHGLR